jgi:hypothetical protein
MLKPKSHKTLIQFKQTTQVKQAITKTVPIICEEVGKFDSYDSELYQMSLTYDYTNHVFIYFVILYLMHSSLILLAI